MSSPIQPGQPIPDASLILAGDDGAKPVSAKEFFAGKKVALFAVPAAFSPTCSNRHLPGFIEFADQILAKGIDEIACLSVNDAFVMSAWKKAQNAGAITMLADGSAEFTKALGLDMDASQFGLGIRAQRFSLLVDDGIVKYVNREPNAGKLEVSGAEYLLNQL